MRVFLGLLTTIAPTLAFVARPVPTTMTPMPLSSSRIAATVAPTTTTTNGDQVAKPAAKTTVAAVPKVAQRWRKHTKQVVTLGPASSSVEMIEKLFLAGADCFRLNFSHGSQEQKKELLDMIRSVEEKYSHPIAILGDLQGPKLRVSIGMLLSLFCCKTPLFSNERNSRGDFVLLLWK